MNADGSYRATAYYVRMRGKVHGPFDVERLRKLHARGQFSRAHEVSTDKRSWQPAGEMPDLFAPPAPRADVGDNIFLPLNESPSPAETSAAGPPESAKWYYNVGDERHGPVSLMELRLLFLNGQITPHDLVWKEGMPDWAPAANQPEFQLLQMNNPARIHALGNVGEGMLAGAAPQFSRVSGLAFSSLTLGIVGLMAGFCTYGICDVLSSMLDKPLLKAIGLETGFWAFGICNVLAIILSSVALVDVGRSRGAVRGRGMAIAGLVMGSVGVAAWLVIWVLVLCSVIAFPSH